MQDFYLKSSIFYINLQHYFLLLPKLKDLSSSSNAVYAIRYFSFSGSCEHMGQVYGIGESWITSDCYQCVCMEPFGVGCCDQWVCFKFRVTPQKVFKCSIQTLTLVFPTVALNLWTIQTGVRSSVNLTLAQVLQWWESIINYHVSGDEAASDQLQDSHGNLTMILYFEFRNQQKSNITVCDVYFYVYFNK